MKHKKIIILLALTIFVLLSIGSVCASDAGDIAISTEDNSQIGLSQDNAITDDLKSVGEDTPLTQIDNDDENLAVENTPKALGAGEGNYGELRDEIGDGGNINLTRSYYTYTHGDGDTIKITTPGVIDGKGAVIDMAGANIRAFEVNVTDNLTIKNLTIKNVNAIYLDGGAIVFWNGNVTIINCNFTNNNGQNGGVFYFNDGNATITNCNFTNNSAYVDGGGAVYVNNIDVIVVTNCIFTNNTARGYEDQGGEGAAIKALFTSTLKVDNCVFTNNTATPGEQIEAGIWMSASGAIHSYADYTVITNSKFDNNYASTAGAICLVGNDVARISNCNFTNNNALYYGALEILGSNVTIEGSIFDGNKAHNSSGAIYNSNDCILSIIGCIFTGNTAPDGCAIYNDIDAMGDMGQLTIVDSTFTSNGGADDYAIYNQGNLTLTGNNVDNIIYNSGIINSTTNVIILANKTVDAKCGETVTLNATLTDGNGNLIEDENLRFTVDGVILPVDCNYAGGVYTLNYIPDKVGQKVVSAILDYDTTVKTGTIIVSIVETQLSAKAVTTTYNVAKDLVVTLKDVYGNAVSNAKITINLNGKSIKVTTDKNGQAKLAINLPVKEYTATITFDGDDSHIKSTTTAKVVVKKASPKIVAKKKTFKVKTKTKKYTITLKDNKGKAIKKAKVTLKVKGKTYKATTGSKGKATFKITKLNKKGKYKATVKYTGNKNFKAATKTIKYITVKK